MREKTGIELRQDWWGVDKAQATADRRLAWSRLWKRAAKAYRGRFKAMVATLKLANAANDLARDCYELSQAESDRRLELLKDLAIWYSDTANVHFRYLTIELVERLEKELERDNA